jgi:heme-degrading monooxygenase HmoA
MLFYTRIQRDWAPKFDAFGAGRTAENPRTQGSGELSDGVMEIFQMQTINGNTNKGQIARSVRFDIARDKNEEFHTLFRNEVLPVLKTQDGFKDELLLVNDQHVLAISVWDDMDSARRYESTTYPQLDRTLRPVMSGKPTVETFDYDSLSTIA